jgi:hypothetical protein
MASYDDVATRWTDVVLGLHGKTRNLTNERMPIRGDMIYSYGSHFEMARALRDKKGAVVAFLINGDTWGPTTSKHQNTVRNVIRRTGVQSVIIPYQALSSAGVSRDSVTILDVTNDSVEVTQHSSHELPDFMKWEWCPVYRQAAMTYEEIQAILDEEHASRVEYQVSPLGPKSFPDVRGTYFYRTGYFTGLKDELVGHERRLLPKHGWRTVEWQRLPDGRDLYTWETSRHWLGESLVEGELTYTVTRHCKECKDTGLAEGPTPAAWQRRTSREHDAAYSSFLVEWSELMILNSRRPLCPGCDGQGTWRATRHRRARFLSGFDKNEPRQSYFFAELPTRKPTTIEEAYESLKPDSVRLAEQMGREVRRQGDIFAIPIPTLTKRALRKSGARIEKMGRLFGTNHAATEVAYLPDGNTLVRGVIHHVPAGRRPDHVRVRVGATWHLAVKNTVPIAA